MESTFRINEIVTTLSDLQIQKLNQTLVFISQFNKFYKDRLKHVSLPLSRVYFS